MLRGIEADRENYKYFRTKEYASDDLGARLVVDWAVANDPPVLAGLPDLQVVVNGSHDNAIDLWAYANKVSIEFSRPGKPTDNAFIESFYGTLRDECLNVRWFDDLTDAREKLEACRRDYNETRSHRSLNELSPQEYRAQWAKQRSENH